MDTHIQLNSFRHTTFGIGSIIGRDDENSRVETAQWVGRLLKELIMVAGKSLTTSIGTDIYIVNDSLVNPFKHVLKHEDVVIIVHDYYITQSSTPTDHDDSIPVEKVIDTLSESQLQILKAANEETPYTGENLLYRANVTYNSNGKTKLADLAKMQLLIKTPRGYRRRQGLSRYLKEVSPQRAEAR